MARKLKLPRLERRKLACELDHDEARVRFFREFKRKNEQRRKRAKLQSQFDVVYESYEKDIAATKDYQEQMQLESAQQFECDEFEDEISRIDSLELTRRAKRCHLDVSEFPLPPNSSTHWIRGNHGTWFIHPKVYREFAKAVEVAEHERVKHDIERRDFWLKLFTAISAALAAVASIFNLIRK